MTLSKQTVCLISLFLVIFFACGPKTDKKDNTTTEKKEKPKGSSILEEYDLTTQIGFEKLLADNSIPLPLNSKLKEVVISKEKNYTIVYDVPYFEGFIDSLQSHYEKAFDKSFLDKGWKKPISGWTGQGTLYFDPQMKYHLKFTIASYTGSDLHQVIFEYGKN